MNEGADAIPSDFLYEVSREHRSVADARYLAERAVLHENAACREAVAMTVQEFAENLAKYGRPDGPAGSITLRAEHGVITIRAKNYACGRRDGERVMRMIAEIAAAPSVRDLYCQRQRELFEKPRLPRVRLGLLRIAFEGGFRLSCSFEYPVLEIVAVRP